MATKVAFVGDLHLNHSTPKSRIDDYPTTCIDKLESLRVSLLQRDVKYLIILGDVFHKPKQSVEFLNRVIKQFLKFKDSGIEVYSIIGNHDEIYERVDSIERTS